LTSLLPFIDKDIFHTTYDLEFVLKKYLGFYIFQLKFKASYK